MDGLLNIGSIQKIEVLQASQVSMSEPDGDNVVVLTTASPFIEVETTHLSAEWDESESLTAAGLLYESTLKFSSPKVSVQNHVNASRWADKPVVIRLTDGNGTKIVMGEAENPCYIRMQKTVPGSPAGFNRYDFQAKWQSPHQARFTE